MSLCQLCSSSKGLEVTFSLTIKQDFSYIRTYRGDTVEPTFCKVLQVLPSYANSGDFCSHVTCIDHSFVVSRVSDLLNVLSTTKVCEGNSEPQFLSLPNIHRDVMMNVSS